MSLTKGIALITGSAQGIGRSIALRLARDGFDIALNDVSSKRDQLRAVAHDIEKIGRRTHLVPADVSTEAEVKGMVRGTTDVLGGLDVMVANAGIAKLGDLASTELDDWDQIMAVNARGAFLCYKYAAAQMVAQGRGGRIIGASSIAGKSGHALSTAYSVSKFAVRCLTQTAAIELGRHNITVNSYAPGVIATPMTADFLGSAELATADKELVEWSMGQFSRKPIKYDGETEDVASIVSYLASKEAHFITGKYFVSLSCAFVDETIIWAGQCIAVDGGITLS